MIEKTLIKRRFLRALPSYEKKAFVQKEMAYVLIEALSFKNFYSSVLEIGAGTGLFTRFFINEYDFDFYIATDILDSCAFFFHKLPVYFLVADGEALPFKGEIFSLIVSNATFQWFLNLKKTFLTLKKLLIPGGILAFTSLGPETMKEIRQTNNLPGLLSFDEILALRPPGFEILKAYSFKRVLYFKTPLEALAYIRETGSMGSIRSRWSLREFKLWSRKYETLRNKKGLPLTFEPILMIWRKK